MKLSIKFASSQKGPKVVMSDGMKYSIPLLASRFIPENNSRK